MATSTQALRAQFQAALRVDNDTLAAFRATGQGWQSRMNAALRDWAHGHLAT